jgi:hypothetical protein
MSNPCDEVWVRDIKHSLKGGHIWVCPWSLRVCNVFDDKTNELVSEVRTNMIWEILDPRIYFQLADNLWQLENFSWGLVKLCNKLLASCSVVSSETLTFNEFRDNMEAIEVEVIGERGKILWSKSCNSGGMVLLGGDILVRQSSTSPVA